MRTIISLLALLLITSAVTAAKVTLDENGVTEIDGKKTFVISFALPPPAGGTTPDGKDGLKELRDAGATFARLAIGKDEPVGSNPWMQHMTTWLNAAAAADIHCWLTLTDVPAFKPTERKKEQTLRKIVARFKDHPGIGAWKAFDEAAWVKKPADEVLAAYKVFHEMDPNHPVILIQAPTKASLPLEPYMATCDITGVDIYPIAYPPDIHSDFENREISVVSDCTKWIAKAARGKPVWMTLQIAWGGTATPGKTLRFPTFPQSRYMAYTASINGARGINYQGGALPLSLNERDSKLGWNWTHWKKVMRPLVEELGDKSPLHPALIAPNSKLPVKVEGAGASDVEFCVREVGDEVFILASKREGETAKVNFTGIGGSDRLGTVMFEEPRKVNIKSGGFEDWFAPNEVHVYRIPRGN